MSSVYDFVYPPPHSRTNLPCYPWLPDHSTGDVFDFWASSYQLPSIDSASAACPQSPTPSNSTSSTDSSYSVPSPGTPNATVPLEQFSNTAHDSFMGPVYASLMADAGLAGMMYPGSCTASYPGPPVDGPAGIDFAASLGLDCVTNAHRSGGSVMIDHPSASDGSSVTATAPTDPHVHFAQAYGFSIAQQNYDASLDYTACQPVSAIDSSSTTPSSPSHPTSDWSSSSTTPSSPTDEVPLKTSTASVRKGRNKGKRFMCTDCKRTFSRAFNLHTHIATHRGIKMFDCPATGCEKSFSRRHDLGRHLNAVHEEFLVTTGQTAQEAVAPLKKNENAKAALAIAVSDIAAPIDPALREAESTAAGHTRRPNPIQQAQSAHLQTVGFVSPP